MIDNPYFRKKNSVIGAEEFYPKEMAKYMELFFFFWEDYSWKENSIFFRTNLVIDNIHYRAKFQSHL